MTPGEEWGLALTAELRSQIREGMSRSARDGIEESLGRLERDLVAYTMAVEAGDPAASEELRHIKATIQLLLAREAEALRIRVNGFLEGALAMVVRVLLTV